MVDVRAYAAELADTDPADGWAVGEVRARYVPEEAGPRRPRPETEFVPRPPRRSYSWIVLLMTPWLMYVVLNILASLF